MSAPRFAKKLDTNHSEIVGYLEKHGVEVIDCSNGGKLDLLCKYKTDCPAWVEVKIPGCKALWTFVQLRFIATTRFSIAIAKDGESALNSLKNREFLTSSQKVRIGLMLAQNPKKFYQPNEVETAIG